MSSFIGSEEYYLYITKIIKGLIEILSVMQFILPPSDNIVSNEKTKLSPRKKSESPRHLILLITCIDCVKSF